MNLQALVAEFETRWADAGQAKHSLLLRLTLLRELARKLHAGRSSVLAQSGAEAREIMAPLHLLEQKAEALRATDALTGSLSECLDRANPNSPPAPLATPRMGQRLGRGKLDRPDRTWERAIAIEAEAQDFTLEGIEALVPMRQVEAWSNALERELWPVGVVLFTETSPTTSQANGWRGCWWTCFAPETNAAACLRSSTLHPRPELAPEFAP